MHLTWTAIAILIVAPIAGLAFWFITVRLRSLPSRRALVIAVVVVLEIYVLIGALLAGVTVAIAAPIWVILVYAVNIVVPHKLRRARSGPP